MNGANGWTRLTRRGRQIVSEGSFQQYRQAAAFPKSLIHPSIADKVWLALARGDYEDAVFLAFKALEVSVRRASGYDDTHYGVPMMRDAFHPRTGPLTDKSRTIAEREALQALFAGAHGSYKNPASHRTFVVSDAGEAREMIVLASHLLRIVDAREEALRPER